MRTVITEVSIECPNCKTIDTIEMRNGDLDTVMMEEHGGELCPAVRKFYQIARGMIYHKGCELSGLPCILIGGQKISFKTVGQEHHQ
jgi:hypothetical protein